MKLSSFAISVLFFVAAIIGLSLIPQLQVDLLPKETKPSLQISYLFPEASPELVEQLATAPLENILSQIIGIQKINSVSSQGRGNITILFDKNEDLAFKKFEVAAQIRSIYKKLPPTLSYPNISQAENENSRIESPLLTYSINADGEAANIQQKAEELFLPFISVIEGVYEVRINGNFQKRIAIKYDEVKLNAYQISPNIILQCLQKLSAEKHFGKILYREKSWIFLRTEKEKLAVETLKNQILPTNNGQIIYLKDVASIQIEAEKPNFIYRINGLNTVTMSILARKDANKINVAQNVKLAIAQISSGLPKNYHLVKEQDESEILEKELNKNYKRAGLSMLILLFFIFLANQEWRYLLVLTVGIFINIFLTLIFVYFWQIKIHLYSLAGLAVSFGMIIDNAIVMVEHLHEKGNKKIFLALLGASLTTVAALLLVFFLPEEEQKNLLDFSKIVTVNLSVSLLVALFFTPAFYEVIYGNKKGYLAKNAFKQKRKFVFLFRKYENLLLFLFRWRKSFLFLFVLAFGFPVFLIPAKIENFTLYNKIFDNDYFKENIRPYLDMALGGGLRPFVRNVYEKDSYRSPEKTQLFVSMEMPYGTTITQMDFVTKHLEHFLKGIEGISQYSARIQARSGFITISFLPQYEKSGLPYQLKSKLIARAVDWEGIGWNVWGVGQGFHSSIGENLTNFRIELRGFQYKSLENYADITAQKLLAHKRIQKVNTNERLNYDEKGGKEFVMRLDDEAKISEGINLNDIFFAINEKTITSQANLYLPIQNQLLPTYIENQNAENFNRYALMHLPLHTQAEKRFVASRLSNLQLEATSASIYKENRKYIRVIGFEYMGSHHFGEKNMEKIIAEMKQVLPLGYEIKPLIWSFDTTQAKKQYALLLVLLLAIYFICAILFESFRLPLVIISVIPISFIGIFATFTLFDFYFDQGGYAAFVLLGGLSVNAAIFIMHDFLFSTKLRTQNRSLLVATLTKSKAVFLTVLSTIFGLFPFLMEGQEEVFWFSLAAGTVGGLIFSLLGVFFVLQILLWKDEKRNPKV